VTVSWVDRIRSFETERHERSAGLALTGVLLVLTCVAVGVSTDTAHALGGVALTVAAGLCLAGVRNLSREGAGEHPVVRPALFGARIAVNALMVLVDPVFGFYAWTAYFDIHWLLRGRWRAAGIPLVAAPVASSQVGGWPVSGQASWAVFIVVWLVNTGIAGLINWFAYADDVRGQRRSELVAELTEANRRLSGTLRENAALQEQLVIGAREAGVDDERRRMAREIHDTLAQGLAGIITQLQAAEGARPGDDRSATHIDAALALARDSLAEARRSVQALRPEVLERGRLADALEEAARRSLLVTTVTPEVRVTGDIRPLHADLEVALLRVAQEALANAAHHAHASRVAVTLSYLDDEVALDVVDDGVGFDPASVSDSTPSDGSGYGLTAMRQRVSERGGTLEVESEPGGGTALSVRVPFTVGDSGAELTSGAEPTSLAATVP
jgi:signal transduction histidine kinase